MRKFLSLFAAALLTLTASATIRNITPTHCFEGDRADGYTLYVELARGAQAGDTIVLADGTYIEPLTFPVNVPVVVMAAEGAKPLVKQSGYFQIHASAEFKGIKFQFVGETGNGYCMYLYDNTSKYLKLEGCEFQDFTQYCVSSWEDYHMDSVIVNNCYFHNLAKGPFYFKASGRADLSNTCDKLVVTNTTFNDIDINGYVSVIDFRNNDGSSWVGNANELLVDHCTFYNIHGEYNRIIMSYKSANTVVSNCIIAQPTANEFYPTYNYGGEVKNNLSYNTKSHRSGPTLTDNITGNPLFVDAANGDFTLATGSPALTAATDGGAVGDPRWVAAPAPAHTYTVAGDNTTAFGTAWASSNEANDMALVEGLYKWEKTDLTLAAGTIEFKVCEDHGWDVAYPGSNYQLAIPEAGIYTITITFNPDTKDVAAVATKTGDAVVIPTIAMHGNFLGSWADTQNFEIAEGNATASLTLNLAAGNYEFGMRIGGAGNWTSNGVAFTRENASAVVEAGSGNLTLAADAAGEYTFTWTYETNTLAITFPAVAPQPTENVIYRWSKVAEDKIGTTILGSDKVTEATVKIHTNTDEVPCLKFDKSYVYADGHYAAIKPANGGFKAGDKLNIAVCFNNSDDSKRAAIKVIAANGVDSLYCTPLGINGRTSASDPAVETYVLASDQDSLLLGRYGNTGTCIILLNVTREGGDTPQPDPTVSVRGTMNEWGETPFELSADKTYATLTIDDIPAGDYQFKMFINGEWRSNGYTFHRGFTGAAGITGNDDNNMVFQADVRGAYTFTWTFANDSLGFIYPEAPQPQGCDWDAIDFVPVGPAEYANQYKVCKTGEQPNVVNIQQAPWADNNIGIYINFPNAVFNGVSLPEGQYKIEGAGILLYLSAFDAAKETEVTVNWNGNDVVFTVYNAKGGAPELNYYMKNNWDAGADWTWKAMTKDGENYKLEEVVFGGTGVNYNTAESDEGSSWVPVANIAGDAISAKDTVTLVLDPAAGTVTATLIGKYNDPNPGVHTYTVAGNLAAAFGTSWDATDAHNDMVLNGVGIYLWEKTELTLPAGTIEFKVCEDHAWTVAYPAENYQLAIAEAGVYTINIAFNPDTKEVTANAQKTGDATVTVDYYLVGSVKGWEAKAENIFTLNAEAGEGIEEYVIETTLEVGEGLKVLSSTGTWYPEGMGNEYVVDQDHAGATTIYFRPAGNAEWEAFGGFMYVVPTGGAGIDAVDANAPAVKVLRNGQILIKKGDKTYNVMGAIVR